MVLDIGPLTGEQ